MPGCHRPSQNAIHPVPWINRPIPIHAADKCSWKRHVWYIFTDMEIILLDIFRQEKGSVLYIFLSVNTKHNKNSRFSQLYKFIRHPLLCSSNKGRGSLKMGVSTFRRKKQEPPKTPRSRSPFSSFFSGAAKATELHSEKSPDQQCCCFHFIMSFFERHVSRLFCLCCWRGVGHGPLSFFLFLVLCHSMDSQTWWCSDE